MNTESAVALKTIEPILPDLRKQVLNAVRELNGATVKEVVAKTGIQRLTVGARLTELKQAGYLIASSDVREGCRVLVPSDKGLVI